MGVIKRGILGGFSGSVGNITGSSWKGIAVMKAKPLSVANPNTAGQVLQRGKMRNIVAYAAFILQAIIKPLNDRFASGQSGYNLFVSRNIALFTAAEPAPLADLEISRGSVGLIADFLVLGASVAGGVLISWTDGVGNVLAGDLVLWFVRNRTQGEAVVFENPVTRADGTDVLAVPATWIATDVIDIYYACRRADGSQVSNTGYATDVLTA